MILLEGSQNLIAEHKRRIVSAFHELYYEDENRALHNDKCPKWRGYQLAKCPLDLWQYQEIIMETKPDVIIETGTWVGGSALFLRDMMKFSLGSALYGVVITIDKRKIIDLEIPGVIQVIGNSVSFEVVDYVRKHIKDTSRIMVILDSDHSRQHVLKELDTYGLLVTEGCYLVVEDTNINGHPVRLDYGVGPWEALEEWLPQHPEFVCDEYRERFMLTFNPNGYYKRGEKGNEIAT